MLRAWGSVLTTAFDLACHVGCNPVVFAGADLAYTDGVHYCRGTIHEDAANHLAPIAARADAFAAWQRDHQRTTCTETDIRGASIVSTPDFVQFRDWLVSRSAAVQPRRVLNATGAGILRGGAITPIDLATMSFPLLAEGAEAIQARLGAAWRWSLDSRDRVVEKLEGAMSRQDGIPLAPWLDFAGDTASSEQITSGIEAAWRSIARAWKSAPEVTVHPANVFWIPGGTARFEAAATGAPAPTVQWQFSTDGGSSWSDIAGATDTTYARVVTVAELGRRFRAVFANASGATATAAAAIPFAPRGIVADFDGDGKPDILWRNPVTGANAIWYMDGMTRKGLGVLETVPISAWTVVGMGDFTLDHKPAILWHHSAWGTVAWYMDGVTRAGHGLLDTTTERPWTAVGTGDFNADGKPDVLWRNMATGANRVWYMDGVTRTGVAALDTEADLAWTIVGTGDFNGDGRPDILWRNTVTGANRVWYMDGVTRTGVAALDTEADQAWIVVGTGDFDGNGTPDILWHHLVTGANVVWCMEGAARTGVGLLAPLDERAWLAVTKQRAAMNRPHLLIDNQDISGDEYAKASSLLHELRTLHFETRGYVERRGLDAELFLPGNIWADINRPDYFIDWTYELVNYVRCISPFIGFHQMMWGRLDVPGEVDGVKASAFYDRFFSGTLDHKAIFEELESEFHLTERIGQSMPSLIESYDELVRNIPEQYRILAPPRAGEIGVQHGGGIINPDLIIYQRRINALYAGGALQPIEDAIAAQGSANYLEIGPGHCFFAYALARCFAGKLRVFLIDLPFVMANGCAYLTCAAGADQIGLVTPETTAAVEKPFVFVPNYLVPDYEPHLPDFHLVHNAISFNEMNAQQIAYYYDLVAHHLADDGVFHIAGGFKLLDHHVDALAAATQRFPNHIVHRGAYVGEYLVFDGPNTFIRA